MKVEYVGTKEQVVDIFRKPLPREAFEYLRQRLELISIPKWMLLNAYLICLRCTWGRTINRTIQSGGANPYGKIHFPLMQRRRYSSDAEEKGMVPGGEMVTEIHRDLSDVEDRGMIPGGAMVTKMHRTEAWCQGEHEWYDFSISWHNFSFASECCHQCQRGRFFIKIGFHWCQPLKKSR